MQYQLFTLLIPFGSFWGILMNTEQIWSKYIKMALWFGVQKFRRSPTACCHYPRYLSETSKTLTDGQGGGEAASGGCHHQQLGDVRWSEVLPAIGWSKYFPQIIPNHWKSSTFCDTSRHSSIYIKIKNYEPRCESVSPSDSAISNPYPHISSSTPCPHPSTPFLSSGHCTWSARVEDMMPCSAYSGAPQRPKLLRSGLALPWHQG